MPDVAMPLNPYYDYAVIHDPNRFFGRYDELRMLYEAIQNRQSISIVGLRRVGKSSLLSNLQLPEIKNRFAYDMSKHIFVLIDLHDYLNKKRADFFISVSEKIYSQAQSVVDVKLSERTDEDLLSQLLEAIHLKGFHTVLLMDAFDRVTRNTEFDPDFFAFLRSLATRGYVSYVTASIKQLHEMAHETVTTSPFFNIFISCEVGTLVPAAARELVTTLAQQAGYPFTPIEVDWILEQGGRHPFLLQVTSRFFFDEKYRSDTPGHVDWQRVQSRVSKELTPQFDRLWNDLDNQQQEDLKHEARQQNSEGPRKVPVLSEAALFRKYVRERFNAVRVELTPKDVKDALDKMDDNEALEKSQLAQTNYVFVQSQKEGRSGVKKGIIVRELLKAAFERTKSSGIRTDSASDWRIYNILYYRYFRYRISNDQITARLGIGSKRQFYREQDKAIQALHKEVMELEALSENE